MLLVLAVQLGLLAGSTAVAPGPAEAATDDWHGEYFPNTSLSGSPSLVRQDPVIDFNWGAGSPAAGFPADNFSVRWTRSVAFTAGTYRFTTTTDDGVRLFVDDGLLIDKWVPQSATAWQATISLTDGDHDIRMEYFEQTGDAVASLTWEQIDSTSAWQGEYFTNVTLSGTPALVRSDAAIDFDWGEGAPAPGLPADDFSVRWTRSLELPVGTYEFTALTDDGVRLYVNEQLVIDQWVPQSSTQSQGRISLSAGVHSVVMEYFEAGGTAVAHLSWGAVDDPPGWSAEYFSNSSLSGSPALVRTDSSIDFDWGAGPPASGLPNDFFSIRWTATLDLEADTYTFGTYTDDGVRLFIDGSLVIDQWVLQPATYHSVEVTLAAGEHLVVMEYFEQTGNAVARLNWARPSDDGAVRINSGGSAYVDRDGFLWSVDQHFSGGVNASQPQSIWNTSEDPLYVDERAGAHSYQIPLVPGDYTVRLHFVELFKVSSGVRQFDVSLEGSKVLESFDIYKEAGFATLVTRSFPVSVTDGALDISFAAIFDSPVVHAIDVHSATTGQDLSPPTFDPIPQTENLSFTEPPSVDVSVVDNGGLNEGFWRVNDDDPLPLFTSSAASSFQQQFELPAEVFEALPLGAHTLSFGASDDSGNAAVKKWRFRKVDSPVGGGAISFDQRTFLTAATPGAELLDNPTTVEVGPDGRVYVGQQNGYIHVLTLDGSGIVSAVERIDTIHDTPNFNPDGSPSSAVGRHLLGIDFDPRSSPSQPILWAVHSDVRFCFNAETGDCNVDTNSGVLTRLVGPDFNAGASRVDYVTGLPRSREIHAPNSVHFGPDGWLYMTVGSHTNFGAPSTAFSYLPESHLTATVLRIDVHGASGSFPLDVEELDANGGQVPGVFEVYATGYRNAYDFTWHSNGRLYVNVNAGNAGNGNTPGPEDGCPDGHSFNPGTLPDFLSIVDRGDYGGHPNPTHGECVLDDGTLYPSPIPPEPNYDPPIHEYLNATSVNGLTEYHVPTFGGQLLGNLVTASWAGDQSIRRVVLNEDGSDVVFDEALAALVQPLDVDVGADGVVYVAEHGADSLQVLRPATPLTGDWSIETPIPVAVQEVGVVGCAGRVYVLGGLVALDTNTNAVWAYDPGTGIWSAAADYPGIAVDHPGAACVDDKVYLIGGLINANNPVSQVFEYTPSTDTWVAKTSLPQARGAMGVSVVDGIIYAAGGLLSGSGPAVTDLTAYNPTNDTWTTLAPMPTARDHLIMEAVGGRLYAMGGRDALFDDVLDANEVYDPSTDRWEARAPLPVPRAGMSSAALHGQIQLWGGEGPAGTPTGTYPQGQMYDPATNAWQDIADQLTPRHGTDGAQLGDRVYVPAGGPQAGGSVTDVNEVFSFISTAAPTSCIPEGSDPTTTDSDSDGYTDQDEIDNGTDPCSSASRPPDADADGVSDRNDPDDDNDGIPDVEDQFQLDADNGQATSLPWAQEWNPGSDPAGEFGNSGFPGVQLTTNGVGFIADRVHAGGAGGFLTITPTAGTYRGSANSQDNGLQVGSDATQPIAITTRIGEPLSGQTVEPGKYGGIFVGLDEDNYLELILTTDIGNGSTGIGFGAELGGTYATVGSPVALTLPGPGFVELFLDLDPASATITAAYRVDSSDPADRLVIGTITASDDPDLAGFFINGLASGVAGTNSTSSSFAIAYDYYRIEAGTDVTAPLEITTSSLPDGTVGSSYSAQLQAAGGTTPYSWQVTSGSLPPGLSLSPSTGGISGTPTTAGSFPFTITATDSGAPVQSSSRALDISVSAEPLQVTTSSLPDGTVGSSYSAQLQATGGTTPYSWQVTSGSLPPGLSLSPSTGGISGTPTTAGSFPFTITATDSGAPVQSSSRALDISVSAEPLIILTDSLPVGIRGQAYSAQVQATGGTTPYTWEVTSGSLPPGLSLNPSTGLISGTPTAHGNYSFTISATDSGATVQMASKSFKLRIKPR